LKRRASLSGGTVKTKSVRDVLGLTTDDQEAERLLLKAAGVMSRRRMYTEMGQQRLPTHLNIAGKKVFPFNTSMVKVVKIKIS
jgi:hypothetical protein